MSDALKRKIIDAGIALAYSTKGAGIASVWAEHLRPHLRIDDSVPTWGVDGTAVYVNPTWTADLSQQEMCFLIAHETLHIALDHVGLAKVLGATTPEQRRLLNLAEDACINTALIDDGIGSMPGGAKRGVVFADITAQGYTGPAESAAIYQWLVKDQRAGKALAKAFPGDGEGAGQALAGCSPKALPGQGDGQNDGEGNEAGAKARDRQRVLTERAAATLREAAQKAGVGSALAGLLTPRPTRASVKQLIRQGFERASQSAQNRTLPSYSRASRRSLDPSIVTPGRIGTEARVAFVGDISGSLGPEGAATLIGFLESVAKDFPNVRVFLVTHTHQVEWKGWLRAGGDTKAAQEATRSTGGTDFAPAYKAVAEEPGGRFDALIHFTDGYNGGAWPECPARQLIVGLWGDASGITPPPPGAKLVPVASVEADR